MSKQQIDTVLKRLEWCFEVKSVGYILEIAHPGIMKLVALVGTSYQTRPENIDMVDLISVI